MTRKYDDYKWKNLNKRVSVKFTRKTSVSLTPWEISNFVGRLNTYYYKNELLNTIAVALNSEINPQNIIILDKAFKVNEEYENLNAVDFINGGLGYLYQIGKPISLFPNKEIYKINLLFKLFKSLNMKLYEGSNRRLVREDHNEYYKVLINEGFNSAVNKLSQFAKNRIIDRDNKNNLNYLKYIDKAKEQILTEYKKYEADEVHFTNINNLLSNNMINKLSKEEKELIRKYYNTFFSYFTKLHRPVVGIYFKDQNQLDILCRAQINTKSRNETFLDLIEISHQSPLKALFEAGISLYSTAKDEKRKEELHKIEMEIKQLEKEKKENELKNLESQNETLKLQNLKLSFEVRQELEILCSKEEENGIKNIINPYINYQLMDVMYKTKNGYSNLVEKNGFIIEEGDIHIIDLKI